jgi:hypothetical protein
MSWWWGMAFLLFVAGCATLPGGAAVSPREEEAVRQAATAALLMPEDGCGNCLDVQARLVLQSFWQSGTVEGYLTGRAPDWLKFVGLTPLGQPLLVLVTDGESFRLVAVPEAKAYEGSTAAAAFRKHAPPGFSPRHTWFWLTGRLARDVRLGEVRRNAEGAGYWLEVPGSAGEGRRLLLFDPATGVVSRALLFDADGKLLLTVQYEEHRLVSSLAGGACLLPGRVSVTSQKHGGALMSIVFDDWILGTGCEAADFTVAVPPGFEIVGVE